MTVISSNNMFIFKEFLHGKVAVVTGGATGIGKAIALMLAQAGASVVVGSRHIHQHPPLAEEILALTLDVACSNSVQTFCSEVVKRLGSIDILVNAAGVIAEHNLDEHPDEIWQQMIQVNLSGTYHMMKHCLPSMKVQGWGRIINIASTAATVGSGGYAAYSASKAGILGLTRCAALEVATNGITCNSISPGWVETDMTLDWVKKQAADHSHSWEEQLEELKQQVNPQQRLIQPSEVAALVVFLCREEARAITMQDLTIAAGGLW